MHDLVSFPDLSTNLETLGGDDVHIWVSSFRFTKLTISRLKEILSGDELQKAASFHFSKNAEEYIYGRGLLRLLLGRYLNVPPADLSFSHNENDKPSICSTNHSNLKFNVSHSKDVIVIVITQNYEVGIDVEYENPDLDIDEIRRTLFPVRENEIINALAGNEKRLHFYKQWTRYEAYLKGLGVGFGSDNTQLLARIDSPLTQAGLQPWLIASIFLRDGYSSAIAVTNTNARITIRSCIVKY